MTKKSTSDHKETRHVVIYGYTKQELSKIIQHFEAALPEFVKVTIDSGNLLTKITLTGINSGVELLRFQMNRLHQNLQDLFSEELVTIEDKSLSQVLGYNYEYCYILKIHLIFLIHYPYLHTYIIMLYIYFHYKD